MKTAPFIARTIAYLIDFVISIVLFYAAIMPVMYLLIVWMAEHGVPLDFIGIGQRPAIIPSFDRETWARVIAAFAASVFLFVFIFHGYFVWQEFKYGRTLGKRLFRLRVVSDPDGGPITWKQTVGRDLWRYVDVGFVVPALISMALDPKQPRVGDRLCKTRVIVSPS